MFPDLHHPPFLLTLVALLAAIAFAIVVNLFRAKWLRPTSSSLFGIDELEEDLEEELGHELDRELGR